MCDAAGKAPSPQIRKFAENLASVDTAQVLLGNSPVKADIKPIDPKTWMQDFDRNTARPGTSRRVSRPTPDQRDDYVERSVFAGSSAQQQHNKSHNKEHSISYSFGGSSEAESLDDTSTSAEDVSIETLQAIIAVIRNVHNSSDEILKTYTRHQVIVALLMAANMAFRLTVRQRMAIKMSVVLGRIAAAIANYREATREAA